MLKRKNKILKIFVILIFIFFAYKIIIHKKSGLENIAANITHPFIVSANKIVQPIKKFLNKKRDLKKLLQENNLLKERNEAFLLENVELKASINYSNQNQELLDFKKRYELDNFIYADIILKKISKYEHYFLINKGTLHGLEKDMIVLYKFQVIGKITESYRWHSKVTLITDPNSKISCYANTSQATGIVTGIGNTKSLDFNFVSHLDKLQEEDLVISSGKGMVYPEGYCLGKITNTEKHDLYYKIKIEPLVKLEVLENCLVTSQEKISVF